MRPLEIFIALGLLGFVGSTIASVASDLANPAPMTDEALTRWAILACITAVGLWAFAHFLLEGWVRRLKRRPEIEEVRKEMMALLPALLAEQGQQQGASTLWLLFTSRGPILRVKNTSSRAMPKVELDEETKSALSTAIHKARRRVYGPLSARILRYGESLFELPPPSNHQVMEALARARRSS